MGAKPLPRREYDFAEVLVDQLLLESFSNERSPYFQSGEDAPTARLIDKFKGKLTYHINHSLSKRQKQVIKSYLQGKREREIAAELGITQQVVHIYKQRAIKQLYKLLAS